MKKMLLIVTLALAGVSVAEARLGRGNCGRSSCHKTCAVQEACPPKCYKTVEVPAEKIVTPVPDTVHYVCPPGYADEGGCCVKTVTAPKKEIRTKNPSIISYTCPADATPCANTCGR